MRISPPELFTGISAVTIANAPDIAVGDALGSCVLNLAMLVVLDAMCRDEPVYGRIDQGHAVAASFSIILIGSVGALVLVGEAGAGGRLLHISLSTPLIIVIYFVAMRTAYVHDRRNRPLQRPAEGPQSVDLQTALTRYAAAAAVVVAAGTWLPFVGQELADIMGWQDSFVGTLFVAGATSLPELVVTISALRLGAADMAIANLLGSNLFNVLVLAIDDISFHQRAAARSGCARSRLDGICGCDHDRNFHRCRVVSATIAPLRDGRMGQHSVALRVSLERLCTLYAAHRIAFRSSR